MGKKKKRSQARYTGSSTLEDIVTDEGPYHDDTIQVEVSCTPHGSRLIKPIDFFKKAFAELTRSYSNGVEIKSVSLLEADKFLVNIYKTYAGAEVIKKLAARNDLEHALKKISIISISGIDPFNRKKDRRVSSSTCSTTKSCTASKIRKGKVVEILGDTYGLGDTCRKFFENNGGFHLYDIESMNISDTPQTITFYSAEDAQHFAEKGTVNIYGKEVYFRVCRDDVTPDPRNISERTVALYGDIDSIDFHHLELYFESYKRSGGGDLEKSDLSANPPVVIFLHVEDAKRVIRTGLHNISGKEIHAKPLAQRENEKMEGGQLVSKVDYGKTVEICGDIAGLSKDALTVYLESRKGSGCGHIKDIDMTTNPPKAIFEDSEAAKRAIENGLHKLRGKEFCCKLPTQKAESKKAEVGMSNISNVDLGNIVEIHGDIAGLGKDSLRMYLESTERSGGGKIEEINLDATPPQVIFRYPEAAKSVVEKRQHTFDDHEFHFKFPVQQKESKENDDESSSDSNIEHTNIVEIHGDIGDLGKESLEMYLENTRLSGGGDIKEINLDAAPPRVIFCDPAAAARACSKKRHSIEGVSFQLRIPKVTTFRDDAIMLCNIQPSTSKNLRSMYLEKLAGSAPQNVISSHDNSVVIGTFSCKIDWNRVEQAYSKKPTLDGTKVVIEQVPVCSGAFISNIPSTASTDSVLLTIENRCGDDSVEDLDYEEGREFAIVSFSNSKASHRLISLEIKIEGTVVDIQEYYPSVVTEQIWKTMHKEPEEICIDVDGLTMDHIMKKHKKDLCKRLKSNAYIKETTSTEGHITTQACFSRNADVPNQTDVFQSFYNEFINKETAADFNNQGVRDLADSLSVTIHSNPGGALAVVGREHDVKRFLESVDKASHIKIHIELPSEKIQLLSSAGCLKDLEKELSVTIKEDEGKLAITGNESQIARVECKLNLKLHNIKTSSLQITDTMWEFLKNQMTSNMMSKFMEDHKIVITLAKKKNAVKIIAISENDLSNGVKDFKKTVGDIDVRLNDNEMVFIKSQRGSQALDALVSNMVAIKKDYKLIKLTGVLSKCHGVEDELTKLLKKNAFVKRLLQLSTGRTRAVQQIFRENINALVEKNDTSHVSLNPCDDEASIEVTGYGNAVNDVVSEVKELSNRIQKEELIFKKPGLSKVIALESSKLMLKGLERDKNVIIIRKEEDKEGNMPRIGNDLTSSRLLCKYGKDNSLYLSVFQGDIAKHKADMIVSPANADLLLRKGVAGAILSAGGSVIEEECNRLLKDRGSLNEGDVVTTGAGKLSCRKIIHAVGPAWPKHSKDFGKRDVEQAKKDCMDTLAGVMRSILKEAEKEKCCVLAVPAISSGVFGFPKDLCARILVKTTIDMSSRKQFSSLKEVHFINNDSSTSRIFNEEFVSSFGMQPDFQNFTTIMGMEERPDVHDMKLQNSTNDIHKSPDSPIVATQDIPARQELQSDTNLGSQHNIQQDSAFSKSETIRAHPTISNSTGIQLELVIGDLAKVKADIIVNSASDDLNLTKNPCARGLSNAAGKSLQRECTDLVGSTGMVPVYSFAETNGGNLQCKKVLHAVCGQYDGTNSEKALKSLILKLLEKTDGDGSSTIAMPALGTGALKFPRDKVAQIMVECVQNFGKNTNIKKVLLVAFELDAPMIAAFKDALKNTMSVGATQNSKGTSPFSPINRNDMVYKLGNVVLEIKRGDITKESTDAIVVFGDKNINLNGAVGTAIKNAEGSKFVEEVRSSRPQNEGTTELLKTANLPSRYIAHVCPKSDSYEGLKAATKDMFRTCDSKGLSSLSLPAIGTGALEKTPDESARLILHSFVELSSEKKVLSLQRLNIILFEEKHVSSFIKEMKEPSLNLGIAGHESGGSWLKKSFSNVVSKIYRSKDKDRSDVVASDVQPSLHNKLSSVALNLYFYSDTRVIREVQDKITKQLEDHIDSSEFSKELFKSLPSSDFDQIKLLADKHDVLVELNVNAGKIKLSGYHKDITSVADRCHKLADIFENEKRLRDKQQTTAQYVQWKEIQEDGSIFDYDPVLNCEIERLFMDKENGARIQIKENDDQGTFELDFSNKDKMTIKNIKTGEMKVMTREDINSTQSRDLPADWDPMPKDASGFEVKVHCVQLKTNSQEFRDVSAKFCSNSNGKITSGNIVKIERIQNPQLYKSYLAKKESMERTAGKNSANKMKLFHGTHPDSVPEINENGFNRSFAGKNGTMYGNGVYFAKDSCYSTRYAVEVGSNDRCMYLAKVLAGKYTKGETNYKVAPKGYDTVVDDPNSPRIHVVFYDNQCYPEYLLYFK